MAWVHSWRWRWWSIEHDWTLHITHGSWLSTIYWSLHEHSGLVLLWLLLCKEKVGQLGKREVRRDEDGVDWWRRPATQVSQVAAQVLKVHLEEDHAGRQWVNSAKTGR